MKLFLEHPEEPVPINIENAAKWTIVICAGLIAGMLGALFLIALKFGER